MQGNRCIGLVREAYSKWERRTPLTPKHVKDLVNKGLRVVVQPCNKRVFMNAQYEEAGATLSDDLSECSVILGVKQVREEDLLPDRTYVFFSHVIKGQPENMSLLDTICKKNVRLIDYECITENGKRGDPRLIAFGIFAGNAGMINILRGLGERMLALGYSNPFLNVPSSYMHPSLNAARFSVRDAGQDILKGGIPRDFSPLTVVFTGNGNVSKGAQEIFSLLPHEMVSVEDLPHLPENESKLYGCVVEPEDMLERLDSSKPFSTREYYASPERYQNTFATKIAPYTSVLVNCSYWDRRYPQTLTGRDLISNEKLLAIADLSCDLNGGIGCLSRSTTVEEPFFMYDPKDDVASERNAIDGSKDSVVMMGVDILPSELPREASQFFGDQLMPFLEDLSSSDGTKPFSKQDDLPPALRGAVIACNGRLTPDYTYISKLREELKRANQSNDNVASGDDEGSTVLLLQGHLFDSGLINQALDIIEREEGVFHVDQIEVRPNFQGSMARSSATVQISLDGGRPAVNELIRKLTMLADLTPNADATVAELPRTYCGGDYSSTRSELVSRSSEKDPPRVGVRGPMTSSFTEPHQMTSATSVSSGSQRRVAVLGAGLVARPLVEYLSRDARHVVTVVSALESEVRNLETMRANVNGRVVNVGTDKDAMSRLVQENDLVVSVLPATMHVPIAKECIVHGKPLVTASYVSEEMQAFHEDAVRADIPILCEMGLDPGMDHMSAMAVIDSIRDEGGKILSFSSLCGGLPAPEVAADNPLSYKFSWSPAGVMSAAQNDARYLQDGEIVEVQGSELLSAARPTNIFKTLNLDVLPNRDSLPYGEVYGIQKTANTVFRGTLRYGGWSGSMRAFQRRGWFNSTTEVDQKTLESDWNRIFHDDTIPSDEIETHTESVRECARFLGSGIASFDSKTKMEAFSNLLADRLVYDERERDMVAMHHEFGVELADGTRETRTSSLIAYGDPDGDTSMAKTVGITAAIGAQLLLNGDIRDRGVLIPTKPSVYVPGLRMLKDEGFEFKES